MRRVQWLWNGWPGQARAHVQLFHPHELEQLHLSQCVSRQQGHALRDRKEEKAESRRVGKKSRAFHDSAILMPQREVFPYIPLLAQILLRAHSACTTSTLLIYKEKQNRYRPYILLCLSTVSDNGHASSHSYRSQPHSQLSSRPRIH